MQLNNLGLYRPYCSVLDRVNKRVLNPLKSQEMTVTGIVCTPQLMKNQMIFFSLSFFSVSESTEWPAMGVLRREKKKKNNHQTKKIRSFLLFFLQFQNDQKIILSSRALPAAQTQATQWPPKLLTLFTLSQHASVSYSVKVLNL